ncbi:MAG: internalization-related competence protein ComEC/Rec2 protein [Candidatus Collierbacteria bacterium GW2011_GWF1_44_12]|uniref:Internalization-related competence protein ComEC/Rec2 protein n=1 Tax=Candidatus Collierbacteria bacterium GW2011_GWF1_44_12 TaxID=1618402 RepID=A0A0G1J077_9BACT|nr:MAG: internalization-related competence protein ComEC/Rec2 protein [Candidatus Collierbacteria bacterium GW2011_GWF1_44_12]
MFWFIRIAVLLFILELRLFNSQVEGLSMVKGRKVRVTGNIDKISRNVSNCKIDVGDFWFEIEGWCRFSQGSVISVIGTIDRSVTDMFFGQMRLTSALIDDSNIEVVVTQEDDKKPGVFQVLREKIRHRFIRVLPVFEAGLVSGMITGDKEGLSRSAYQLMIDSGTIHIIVASGYNVMLVAGTLMSGLFWLLKRSRAMIFTLVSVVLYTLLAGGDPPVVRAAIMAGVLLIGGVLGRKSVSWWSLLLAGWVMVMIEPEILTNASFQLSMGASVGLMIVYPMIMSMSVMKSNRLIELSDKLGIMTTVSTMMTTAPIIWWHFGRFSAVALLSNVLILPFVSVIMILGVMTLVLGGLTAPFLYAASHWVVMVIEFFARG